MADGRFLIAAVLTLAVGSFAILVAMLEWRRERRLRAVGERTDGVVTSLRWSGTKAFPVFRFQTPDGHIVAVKGQFGSSPPMYRDGDPVRVLYDPADPQNARIDRAAFGTLRIVFFLALGTLFAAIGVVLLSLPIDVTVEVQRLPATIEATAYFVIAEALTNVAKHADATRVTVLAHVVDGTLRVEIRDDGVGGAQLDGAGLRGLTDRLAALEGRLWLDSRPGEGTLVAAEIPLRDAG